MIITIAKKNANTLKKLRTCRKRLFCTFCTKSEVHCILPILRTVHNIRVTPKTRKAPYPIYMSDIHAFLAHSASLAFMMKLIHATTKNTNRIAKPKTLMTSRSCPPALWLQLESWMNCPG